MSAQHRRGEMEDKMKVCMIITDGFEEAETLCPFDMLVRGGVDVDIYSLLDQDAKGRSGAVLTDLKPFSTFNDAGYEALILPGGPEWQAIEADPKVQEVISTFIKSDRYVCAICAAPTILGRAGYLKGKNYTCFGSMDADFGGTHHEQYVVVDGKIITASSAAASIDFGLKILEILKGQEVADKVKNDIYYHYKG